MNTLSKWPETRLKWLSEEPFLYGANEAALEDNSEWPRFVRITDVDNRGQLRKETFKSLDPELAKPFLLQEGDVLFARSGATVGKSFLYSADWGNCCFAGYLVRIRPNLCTLNPKFLYYFTQSTPYWSQVKASTIKATIQNFSAEKYANVVIPKPPIDLQNNIADYLDRETGEIDELIGEKERMLSLLEEKRSALVTHAVTRGLDPNALLKPSGLDWLGEIPKHWETRRLKFLAAVRTGLTIGKDYGGRSVQEFSYLRVANVQDGYLSLSHIKKVSVPESEVSSCLLKSGDVLMNEGGDIDKLGRGCVWRGEVSPCLHQNHVFCVRPLY